MTIPTIDPESYAAPLRHLRASLANIEATRTLLSVDSPERAEERIVDHLSDEFDPSQGLPLVILSVLDAQDRRDAGTGPFLPSGSLLASFQTLTPRLYRSSHTAAYRWFLNLIGKVRLGLILNADSNPSEYLHLDSIQLVDHGEFEPEEHDGLKAWGADLEIGWRL